MAIKANTSIIILNRTSKSNHTSPLVLDDLFKNSNMPEMLSSYMLRGLRHEPYHVQILCFKIMVPYELGRFLAVA